MFFVYILKSRQNNSYYTGSCQDIKERVALHNHNLVRSTKRYGPWQLVYIEQCESLANARQKELKIKSWKKRSAIEKLIENSKFK